MKHVLVYQFTCCVIHREGNMLSRGWTVQSYVHQKNVKKKANLLLLYGNHSLSDDVSMMGSLGVGKFALFHILICDS